MNIVWIGGPKWRDDYTLGFPPDSVLLAVKVLDETLRNNDAVVSALMGSSIAAPSVCGVTRYPSRISLRTENFETLCGDDFGLNLARAVFGRDIARSELIIGDRAAFTRPGYFPDALAQQGDGIFFDERLISSLVSLRVVEDAAQVATLEHLGGWNSLDELTARISVSFASRSTASKESLVLCSRPFMTLPPVNPVSASKVVSQRRAFLELIGVKSNILRSADGYLYWIERAGTVEVLLRRNAQLTQQALRELAYVCALADTGSLLRCLPTFETHRSFKVDAVTDYLEISSPEDVATVLHPNLLSLLVTDGLSVYWEDLTRSFRAVTPERDGFWYEKARNLLAPKAIEFFERPYESFVLEMSDLAWIERKLRSINPIGDAS